MTFNRARFEFRNGTAVQWATKNPVLRRGEPGVEWDQHRFKIGDGSTPWSGLPYSGAAGSVEGVQAVRYNDQTGWPARPFPTGTGTVQWVSSDSVAPAPPAEIGRDYWIRPLTTADVPSGSTVTVRYNNGWPARPTSRTDVTVLWLGGVEGDPPPSLPATSGRDLWIRSAV